MINAIKSVYCEIFGHKINKQSLSMPSSNVYKFYCDRCGKWYGLNRSIPGALVEWNEDFYNLYSKGVNNEK